MRRADSAAVSAVRMTCGRRMFGTCPILGTDAEFTGTNVTTIEAKPQCSQSGHLEDCVHGREARRDANAKFGVAEQPRALRMTLQGSL